MMTNDINFEGKRVLITGGTGSLGKKLLKRLLSGTVGNPSKIIIFSRDEAKQHQLRSEYMNAKCLTEDIAYTDAKGQVAYQIGDVRDKNSLVKALKQVDIVFHAAALKQVPSCEYCPDQAILTNVIGAQNIVDIIQENRFSVEIVVGISTDKAVQPVNVMGMTKSLQERIFMAANLATPDTKFVLARYGNVLASRGSVIPYFCEQIKNGSSVTVTHKDMTRFLLSLEEAVDVILHAAQYGHAGEIYVPITISANIMDIAKALIQDRDIKITTIGIRPGEKNA